MTVKGESRSSHECSSSIYCSLILVVEYRRERERENSLEQNEKK